MEIIRIDETSMSEPRVAVPDSAVAIGNFDGLHKAHMTLLDTVKNIRGLTPSVFTFDLRRSDCLTTTEEKLALMENHGIERVFLAHFDSLRDMSCDKFVSTVLRNCGCAAVVCGFNFRFGKGAAGDSSLLAALSEKYGIEQITLPACKYNGCIISSSEIRKRLASGSCDDVTAMMGRPFFIEGTVEHGYSEGKKLVPTLNIEYPEKAMPEHGVYITVCESDGRMLAGVSNVGYNPTIRKNHVTCETNLLFDSGDFYGKKVRIFFLRFLRPEKKFADIAQLKEAIMNDVERAKKFHTEASGMIGSLVSGGLSDRG